MQSKRQFEYHVTPAANLPSILQEGLLPLLGLRADEAGETIDGVYLFASFEDAETALMSWMGEELGEESAAILEVDPCENEIKINGFELIFRVPIPPERVRVLLIENEGGKDNAGKAF